MTKTAQMRFTQEQAFTIMHAAFERTSTPELGAKIYVVKDDGAYMMVFGDKAKGIPNVVEYATGFNPKTDPDYYERSREEFGGDDFGEEMLIGYRWAQEIFHRPQTWSTFVVEVTDTQISLSVE